MHSRLVTSRLTFVGRELVPEHSAKDLGVILDTNLACDDDDDDETLLRCLKKPSSLG